MDRRDDSRRRTVHGQLTDPLGAEGTAGVRVLDQDGPDARRIERGGDQVGRESIVLITTVVHLYLLDRRPAYRLQTAAFDLSLRHNGMQRLAAVDGSHEIGDAHFAGRDIDVDIGDGTRPGVN